MQWERIQFGGGLRTKTLEMGDLFDPRDVLRCAKVFEEAVSPSEAIALWNTRKDVNHDPHHDA
jgi:proteasome accessory factor A